MSVPSLHAALDSSSDAPTDARSSPAPDEIETEALCAYFGQRQALFDVSMEIPAGQVTALVGPTGCGKSTFIRCINRLHESGDKGRVTGRISVGGRDIHHDGVEASELRRQVGMVFQTPTPFPKMSVRQNVLAGAKLTRTQLSNEEFVVERALNRSGLWAEVKDRLDQPGTNLSKGQQQRLCIARTLVLEPRVLLLDEPCSALDPRASSQIEDLVQSLAGDYTIALVTHNIQQAARVSSRTAFFLKGEMVECSDTDRLLTSPSDPRTEAYLTGRYG